MHRIDRMKRLSFSEHRPNRIVIEFPDSGEEVFEISLHTEFIADLQKRLVALNIGMRTV